MGLKFNVGAAVRQVMPAPMTGTVTEATIVGSEVHYKVDCVDAEGNVRSKFFEEDQIEAVPQG